MSRVAPRLVRASLRFLRERVGEAAFQLCTADISVGEMEHNGADAHRWEKLLGAFEKQAGGDETSWSLVREMTRYTMAVAVDKGWSIFLADATPQSLLARANNFWAAIWDTGELVVAESGPRRALLRLEKWPDAPAIVGPIVAEACTVFLVRLGERSARAVDRRIEDKVEVEVTW